MDRPIRQRLQPTKTRNHLTTQPQRRNQEPQWNTQASRPNTQPRPNPKKQNQNEIRTSSQADRWIQAYPFVL